MCLLDGTGVSGKMSAGRELRVGSEGQACFLCIS